MGKRKRGEEKATVEGEYDLPPTHTKKVHLETNKRRLIVILHGAQLETVKVNKIEFKRKPHVKYLFIFRLAIHSSC